MSKRVAVYARVSTTRQAENDISIPDQLAQARTYCKARGWIIAREFVDAGASALDDKRPQYQAMMNTGCIDPSPFDVVLVHSQSRLFRDPVQYGFSKRRLAKHGVSLVSITQDFGQGPAAEFAEQVIAAADALHSAETAKHVTRTMLENARQGFWNGAPPPFGYRTMEVERWGQRSKKRLEIEPQAAETVRLIFKLFLEGDGQRGPMGIKSIASWLNARGIGNGQGKPFYTGTVHKMLTRTSYAGKHYYNRHDSRTRKAREKAEWVAIEVPAIVSPADFKTVQARLAHRRPATTPPRIVASNVLLTGLVRCEGCGGPMMIRTGKGNRYRYYACAGNRLKGRSACANPVAIPEGRLNGLVLNALTDRLLTPERLPRLLQEAQRHRRAFCSDTAQRRAQLRRTLADIESQIHRLLAGVSDGATVFKSVRDYLAGLEARREEATQLLNTLQAETPPLRRTLSKAQAKALASNLKQKLCEAPPHTQRRYVHGLVSTILVGAEKTVISGSHETLAAALTAQSQTAGEVRSFAREWRTRKDSNLRPPDS
jgi:site-specific DNA recombinase